MIIDGYIGILYILFSSIGIGYRFQRVSQRPGHQRRLRAPHLSVGALHAATQLDGRPAMGMALENGLEWAFSHE